MRDDIRRTIRARIMGALLLCTTLCAASPAMAQGTVRQLISDNSGLIITLVVLTSASTTTYVTQGLTDRLLDKAFADTQRYMENNSAAVQHDVTLGAGDSLEDLATIYGLEPHEQRDFFARAHAQRAEVMDLFAGGEIGRAEAKRFMELVLTPEQFARFKT